jgi:hypothetical protein
MAAIVSRQDSSSMSPKIKKVDSKVFQVRGRINKSCDQIDYSTNKSVFLSFSDSTPRLKLLNGSGSLPYSRRKPYLEKIRELLMNNKAHSEHYLLKTDVAKQDKISKAYALYSNIMKKAEAVSSHQRVSKGFFMKVRNHKASEKGVPAINTFSRRLLAGKIFKGVDLFYEGLFLYQFFEDPRHKT